jgi:dephospho-CoA kinase
MSSQDQGSRTEDSELRNQNSEPSICLRVGLTGGIGTGKSYVLARFHDLHVPTIDADDLVHEALGAGSAAVHDVVARFGPDVLAADGAVDRRRLAAIVFASPEARRDLETLLHPLVYRAITDWFARIARERRAWAGVADIPLLYETGREGDFDVVVVTACDPELQVRRVMARDGTTETEARRRLAAQWPIGEKTSRADHVIWTGGEYEETDRQVVAVYHALKDRAGLGAEEGGSGLRTED